MKYLIILSIILSSLGTSAIAANSLRDKMKIIDTIYEKGGIENTNEAEEAWLNEEFFAIQEELEREKLRLQKETNTLFWAGGAAAGGALLLVANKIIKSRTGVDCFALIREAAANGRLVSYASVPVAHRGLVQAFISTSVVSVFATAGLYAFKKYSLYDIERDLEKVEGLIE